MFVSAGVVLVLASFHLPSRLNYTRAPHFTEVTTAAWIGQGLLHTLVVGLSILWRIPKAMTQ